jgi:hypothetical protein
MKVIVQVDRHRICQGLVFECVEDSSTVPLRQSGVLSVGKCSSPSGCSPGPHAEPSDCALHGRKENINICEGLNITVMTC